MREWPCIRHILRVLISFLASFPRYLFILISFRSMMILLNPAITDLKGPTNFFHYRQISVIANIEIRSRSFRVRARRSPVDNLLLLM